MKEGRKEGRKGNFLIVITVSSHRSFYLSESVVCVDLRIKKDSSHDDGSIENEDHQ